MIFFLTDLAPKQALDHVLALFAPSRGTRLFLAGAIGLLLSLTAQADPDTPRLTSGSPVRITGLRWKNPKHIEIEPRNYSDRKSKPMARVQGAFYRSDEWTLLCNNSEVKLVREGPGKATFVVPIPIERDATRLYFRAISPFGKVEMETLILYVPDSQSYYMPPRPKPHVFTVSLGPSLTSYNEASRNFGPTINLNQIALTMKAAYAYLLGPRWDLGVNMFFTVKPLTTNVPDSTIRYLGINGRIGYSLPFVKDPWRISILGGWYYTTTFPSGQFGFQDMSGPQLFPVIRRSFSKGDSVFAYFKFSPVSNSGLLDVLTLTSREVAGGGGWVHPIGKGKTFSVLVDVSNLALELDSPDTGDHVSIQSTSTTVSFGLGF